MKRSHTLLIAVSLFTLACKKSGPSPGSYYFKATVNGVPLTFNASPGAKEDTTGNFTVLFITGATNATDSQLLELQINNNFSGKPIVAGTYHESNSSDFAVYGTYSFMNSGQIYRAGQADSLTYPYQVNISAIDASTVKGTFSGVFYNLTAIRGDSILTFANGEFYVPLQH